MRIEFFIKNLDVIFFIYGLAFFIMGIAIFIQPKKESQFKLAGILWLLAAFGFTHGANEFLDMWAIIKGRDFPLDILRIFVLTVSYLFLFEFGRRLLCLVKPISSLSQSKFTKLFFWWLTLFIGLIIIILIFISPDAWRNSTIITRYLLGFPGGLSIGIGFLLYYKYNKDKLGPLKIKKYFYTVAISFIAYGLLGGLVVPKGNFFPANWLNTDSFLSVVKLPVQILRALFAITATWGICGLLRIFSWEKEYKIQQEITERQHLRLISDGLRAVVSISDELISCPDVDTLFKISVEFARNKLGVERCAIFVQKNGYMVGTYGTDRYGHTTDEHAQRFPQNETWQKRCRMIGPGERQWFVVNEPYLEWTGKEARKIGRGGWIVVTPIQSAKRAIGVFVNDTAISGSELDSVKQDILAVFSSLLGNITERKQMEKEQDVLNKELTRLNNRLEKLALRDSHTGLYNYRYLTDIMEAEFERAVRYNHPFSILMMDLDYFKSINDVYGHQFGDLVLKQFAGQLKNTVRRYDIVVRFGGEEFVVISPGIDKRHALTLGQRILDTLNEHDFGDVQHKIQLKLTIAISSYPEDRAAKAMDLIGIADQVLSKAKEDGGNRVYSSLDLKKAGVVPGHDKISTAEVKSLKEKIEKLTKRANQSLIEAVFAFAKTIEFKDQPTADHAKKAVHYATEIAKALGLSKEEVENVGQACILHDLGKVGISEQILMKKSKLSPEEFEEIKKHPQIGADIIRPIHFLHNIIPFMLYHHESWDGKGYPDGLKGERIPLGARIVAIADVYQALTSKRPYRQAYSKEEAIKIIKETSGSQFDPKIVELFIKILEKETQI